MHYKVSTVLHGVAVVALLSAVNAHAQTATTGTAADLAETAPNQQSPTQLQEVIITAQRRQENLQRVPLAVTSFTKTTIEDRNLLTTLDLTKYVPNMVSSQSTGNQAGSNSYSLRGISNTESIPTFDTPIGTYIDDIYVSRQAFNNVLLFDIAQVDVLRGPQGTLFGRNTTGGAIVVTSIKPSDQPYLNAEAAYGSRNHYDGRVAINLPLTDTLFMQASVFGLKENGFFTSRATNTTVGDEADFGARVALRYAPNANFDWFVSAEYVSVEGLEPSIPSFPAIEATAGKAATLFNAYRTVNTLYPTCHVGANAFDWLANKCQDSISTEETLISNIKYDWNGVTLNFISGYRGTSENFTTDFLGNNTAYLFPNFFLTNDGRFNQFSQEVKANGTIFNDRVKYVAGLYFFHEVDNDVYGTQYGSPEVLGPGIHNNSLAFLRNSTDSYAAYIQTDTKITDKLTLTAAVRYTYDHKTVRINFSEFIPGFGTSYDTSEISKPEISAYRATPKVALQYQFSDAVMAYASATNGFKSGGWNARASSAVGFAPFFNEYVWSYELGIHSEFLDHRVRVNADVFQADYRDLQISAVLANVVPSVFATQNAGNSRVRGFELESHAIVLPGLTADVSLGYQDAKYTYITPEAMLAGFSTKSAVILAPPVTVTAGFSYGVAVPQIRGRLRFTANIQYIPSYNAEPTITYVTQDAKPVSASAGYTTDNGRYTFEIYCNNCLGQVYIQDPGGTSNGLGVLPFVGARIKVHI